MEEDPYERGRMHPAHYSSARLAMSMLILLGAIQEGAALDFDKLAEYDVDDAMWLKLL